MRNAELPRTVRSNPARRWGSNLRRRRAIWIPALAALLSAASMFGVAEPAASQIPPLDCSGDTIYMLQRPTAGTTTGRLNSVAVGTMTPGSTGAVAATQATTSLLPASGNALGITEGGLGAWATAPQNPTGTGATLTFTLHEFETTSEAWTPHTATIDTAGRLPAGVTAASIRTGGIVAGAIDPLTNDFYWAWLANGPSNVMTVF